jgi:hypothetical protein
MTIKPYTKKEVSDLLTKIGCNELLQKFNETVMKNHSSFNIPLSRKDLMDKKVLECFDKEIEKTDYKINRENRIFDPKYDYVQFNIT